MPDPYFPFTGANPATSDRCQCMRFLKGETAWHGNVQIFDLIGHEKAQRAYAWQFTEQDETKSVAVLEIPPVDSPESAVKEAVAAKARQK